MKKTITLLAVIFNLCFCIKPLLAQCPGSQGTDDGPTGASETMIGQSVRNTCGFTMTGATFFLGSANLATLTLRVYSGNTSCSGGALLKSGTIAAGTSGNRTISLASSQALNANTTYYLEVSGAIADVSRLFSQGGGTYAGGNYYYSNSTESCTQLSADDLRFALVGAVLPIELTQFDANTEGSKNNLTWRTESELHNRYFDIERSTDGNTFQSIGQVKGNNKPSSYQFVDNQPFATSYYRLRQIDFDGTETFSKIVSVQLKGKSKSLTIYPTLVSNGILTVDTEGGQLRDFSVTNLLGQQVLSGKTPPSGVGGLDVSSLAKGTYILKVGSEVAKFVKQ